jgi:tetratricopeptide (TPR) repeat protein
LLFNSDMFISRLELLFRPLKQLWRLSCRRPKISLMVALLSLPFAGLGGVFLWSRSQAAAAENALSQDDLVAAREHLDASLKFWPDDASTHLLAARIARLTGNFPDAEQHLDECKRIDGMSDALQLEWCLLRAHSGDLSQVEDGLWQSLNENHPRSLLIIEALVYAYIEEMRYATALGCLAWWLERQPDHIRALDWRGWVRGRMDYKDGMYEDYKRVLQLAPEHWRTRLRLAHALLADKDTKAAHYHLGLLKRSHGDDSEVLAATAECHALLGEMDEARRLLDQLLQHDPKNAPALLQRGRMADSPAQREVYFRRALQAQPGLYEARFQLYYTLLQQKRSLEADAELKKYKDSTSGLVRLKALLLRLEKMPRDPDVLADIAEIILPGQEDMGVRLLRKALEANPRHQKTHAILASLYEKQNQPQRAAYHANLAADATGKTPVD